MIDKTRVYIGREKLFCTLLGVREDQLESGKGGLGCLFDVGVHSFDDPRRDVQLPGLISEARASAVEEISPWRLGGRV